MKFEQNLYLVKLKLLEAYWYSNGLLEHFRMIYNIDAEKLKGGKYYDYRNLENSIFEATYCNTKKALYDLQKIIDEQANFYKNVPEITAEQNFKNIKKEHETEQLLIQTFQKIGKELEECRSDEEVAKKIEQLIEKGKKLNNH